MCMYVWMSVSMSMALVCHRAGDFCRCGGSRVSCVVV